MRSIAEGRIRVGVLVLGVLALGQFLPGAGAQEVSGNFRFGHISWTSQGNLVNFTLQAAFKRDVNNDLFRVNGMPAKVGDVVQAFGREPPTFMFGDSQMASIIRLTVDAYSEVEDWVLGSMHLQHRYEMPNDNGRPWIAEFVGCCRIPTLLNNADKPFGLRAEVDLQKASRSPAAASLPMISVPFKEADGSMPSTYIPTLAGNMHAEWGATSPFYVGNAIQLHPMSYVAVPLEPFSSDYYMGNNCSMSRSGPGCLYQLLAGKMMGGAITVEGWVNPSTATGGYVFATGRDPMTACPETSPMLQQLKCDDTTFSVKLTDSHITVAHTNASNGEMVMVNYATTSNFTGKWMHLAVVRRGTGMMNCPGGEESVTYEVYENGMPLWQVGLARTEIVQHCGTWTMPEAARYGSLLLGRGGQETFTGYLDEWRIWNGYRSSVLVNEMKSEIIRPQKEAVMGDLSSDDVGDAVPILVALYDFDMLCPIDTTSGQECAITQVEPVYPKEEYLPTGFMKSNYFGHVRGTAMTAQPDSSGVMSWESAVLDDVASAGENGRMFFNPKYGPGMYQITLSLAMAGGIAKVPLDFIVNVLDTNYDMTAQAFKLCDHTGPCHFVGNHWVPTISFWTSIRPDMPGEAWVTATSPLIPWTDASSYTYPATLKVYSGFEIKIDVYGIDKQADGKTQVSFAVGTLPRGMSMVVSQASDIGKATLSWRPCMQDIGSQVVCLSAVDWHADNVTSAASGMHCLNFHVMEDPAPRFHRMRGLTQLEDLTLTIGRMVSIDLTASDHNCYDSVMIDWAAPYVEGAEQPPGAMLHAENHDLLDGQCVVTRRQMTWTPAYNHGGWMREVCFVARDSGGMCSGGMPKMDTHCLMFTVRRCVYAVQADQELQEVAGMYNTDWMRLWSLNMELGHPDFIMFRGQSINIGHMYRAPPRELPQEVAKRMGMTMEQLGVLNSDLRADRELEEGSMLCVIPNSCEGMSRTIYSDVQLADQDNLAKHKFDNQ